MHLEKIGKFLKTCGFYRNNQFVDQYLTAIFRTNNNIFIYNIQIQIVNIMLDDYGKSVSKSYMGSYPSKKAVLR